MCFEFVPSANSAEYLAKYSAYLSSRVLPLGRPRANIRIAANSVTFQCDRSGALAAIPVFVELAAGALETMEWDEVEESPSGWWGNLEPESPTLYMQRLGPRLVLAGGFQPDPVVASSLTGPDFDLPRPLILEVEESETHRSSVALQADGSGFLALARLGFYLAEAGVAPGFRASLRASRPDGRPLRFVFELATFPKGVPWARPPDVGRNQAVRN